MQSLPFHLYEAYNGKSDWVGAAWRTCRKNPMRFIAQERFNQQPGGLNSMQMIQKNQMRKALYIF